MCDKNDPYHMHIYIIKEDNTPAFASDGSSLLIDNVCLSCVLNFILHINKSELLLYNEVLSLSNISLTGKYSKVPRAAENSVISYLKTLHSISDHVSLGNGKDFEFCLF